MEIAKQNITKKPFGPIRWWNIDLSPLAGDHDCMLLECSKFLVLCCFVIGPSLTFVFLYFLRIFVRILDAPRRLKVSSHWLEGPLYPVLKFNQVECLAFSRVTSNSRTFLRSRKNQGDPCLEYNVPLGRHKTSEIRFQRC